MRRFLLPVAAAAVLALPAVAGATTYYFGANGTGTDGSLSAEAQFTPGSGQISITITNLLGASVIKSAGQSVSDISFDLSRAPGTLGSSSASGQLVNVASDNSVTDVDGQTRRVGSTPRSVEASRFQARP